MTTTVLRRAGNRWVRLVPELSSVPDEHVFSLFSGGGEAKRSGVVGPQGVVRHTIPGFGKVVVKHYLRGGALGHLIRRWHLWLGRYRAEEEFRILEHVRGIGVCAPRPLGYGVHGRWWYSAWLLMQEIEGVESLAELSKHDEQRALVVVSKLADQIGLLIEHDIFHVDLHPGNVLVSSADDVFVLDFDKALRFRQRANQLRDKYIRRWRRAVLKHDLPESLIEALCCKLRRNFESCNQSLRAPSL